ncbi:MAG TPA: flagellar motor switch protein FliM [Dehalococcoidia bacterium]
MSNDTKILSQWEIDALLKSLPEEEGESGRLSPSRPAVSADRSIKPYDFRRPDKFSKDQIRTLLALHQGFARLVSTALSSQLRSVATVKLSSIDQSLYEEYVQQLPTPTVIYVVSMEPMPGTILVEFSMDLAMVSIDRLLGGAGRLLDQPHEITDIEITLLRTLSRSFLGSLTEAWENVATIKPKLQDIAFGSQMVQVASANDVCIVVLFEVHVGEVMGGMSICLPYVVLEGLLPKLTNQAILVSGQRKAPTRADKEALQWNLKRAEVTLSVCLGSAEVTTRELLELQVGDVLRLEAPVSRPLDVTVIGQTKFRGYPGLLGSRLAVRVSEVLPLEESEVDELAG